MDELLAQKFAGIDNLRDLPMVIAQDESIARGKLKLTRKKFTKEKSLLPLIFFLVMPYLLTA